MALRAVMKTARLTLRPPLPGDAEAIADALADWQVTRWLSAPPWPYGTGDATAFLAGIGRSGHWVIEHDGDLAGLIGIKPDLGYWLARQFWGHGLMKEAVGAIVAAHFADPGAAPLVSGYFKGNLRSAAVLDSLGFACGPAEAAFARPLGHKVTIQRMMLTRDDWLAANPLVIETERLVLRPFDPAHDVGALARIGGDPRVAPMLMSVPSPWSEEGACDWITRAPWHGCPGFRLGIFLKDGTLIGATGLGPGDPMTTMYFIDPSRWGQGYATEAMRGFLDWTACRFAPEGIEADHFTDNPASARVLEKLGFTETGHGTGISAARSDPAPVRIWHRRF